MFQDHVECLVLAGFLDSALMISQIQENLASWGVVVKDDLFYTLSASNELVEISPPARLCWYSDLKA